MTQEYAYTGHPITTSVTVKEGTKELTLGEDYEIDYSDNTDVGVATIIIRGIGDYYNKTEVTFEITPVDIAKSVTFSAATNKWDGADIMDFVENNLILQYNGVTLRYVDYYIASGSSSYGYDLNGEVTLNIKGSGNFTGSIKKTVEVKNGLIKLTKDLETPVLSSITNTNSGVKIAWGKVSGAAKYRVFRKTYTASTKKWSSWSKLADTESVNYTDKTVKAGTKYLYTVRCISADGKTYTSNYDTTGIVITYVAAPIINSIKNVNGGVKLAWPKSAGAAKYRVYRKTGSGSWAKLGDATTNSYTDTKAANGTKYTYTVRCLNSAGKTVSAYDTTGKTIVYVARPSISKLISAKTKQMSVKWSKNAKATGYHIQYSTSSTFASGKKTVTVKGATNVNKTISKLTAKKKYYVRVRAYKTVSEKNYYSAWSAPKNVVTK